MSTQARAAQEKQHRQDEQDKHDREQENEGRNRFDSNAPNEKQHLQDDQDREVRERFDREHRDAADRGREVLARGHGQQVSIGRIVHFRMNDAQIEDLKRLRNGGGISHVGSTLHAGQVYPMIVVRVMKDEHGPGHDGVHGQVFLDGNDTLHVESAGEGNEPGQWFWPARE